MERYIQKENQDGVATQKIFLASATTPGNMSDCYDCNICLDNAQDPVVTLCGHLYCWPCIYKWLHSQCTSPAQEEQQQCPVCKSTISKTTVVPLYGRGQASSQNESKGKSLNIPNRPQACGIQALITTPSTSASTSPPSRNVYRYPYVQSPPESRTHHNQHYYSSYGTGMQTLPSGLHPIIGMLGEMVCTSVFGDTQARSYWYPNSYQDIGSSSPRVRRQEMQAEKSLNRISIFLFCCFVLCLLLF